MASPTPPLQRDIELIRDILFWMEKGAPKNERPSPNDEARFAYHCHLMKEAGFIDAMIRKRPDNNGMMMPDRAAVTELLWKGHELLEAIRNNTIWNKTKALMAEKGIPALFDIVVAIAKGYAKKNGVETDSP